VWRGSDPLHVRRGSDPFHVWRKSNQIPLEGSSPGLETWAIKQIRPVPFMCEGGHIHFMYEPTKQRKPAKPQGGTQKPKFGGSGPSGVVKSLVFLFFHQNVRGDPYVSPKRKGAPYALMGKQEHQRFQDPWGSGPPKLWFCFGFPCVVFCCPLLILLCFCCFPLCVLFFFVFCSSSSHMNGTGLICLMAQVSILRLGPTIGIWSEFLHTWRESDFLRPIHVWRRSDQFHVWTKKTKN